MIARKTSNVEEGYFHCASPIPIIDGDSNVELPSAKVSIYSD